MNIDMMMCEKVLEIMQIASSDLKQRNYNALQLILNKFQEDKPKVYNMIRLYLVEYDNLSAVSREVGCSPCNVRSHFRNFKREIKQPINYMWISEGIENGDIVHDRELYELAIKYNINVTYKEYEKTLLFTDNIRNLYLPSKLYNSISFEKLYTIKELIEYICARDRHFYLHGLNEKKCKELVERLSNEGFLVVKKYTRERKYYKGERCN